MSAGWVGREGFGAPGKVDPRAPAVSEMKPAYVAQTAALREGGELTLSCRGAVQGGTLIQDTSKMPTWWQCWEAKGHRQHLRGPELLALGSEVAEAVAGEPSGKEKGTGTLGWEE